jgi:hypothetical protein
MPNRLSAKGVTIIVVLAACPPGYGQDMSRHKEILEQVLTSYRARRDQRNPIWAKYALSHYESALSGAGPPGQKTRDLHWTVRGGFAQKGVKTRVWADSRYPLDNAHWKDAPWALYNGEVSIQAGNQEKTYILSRKPIHTMFAERPTSISREEALLETLERWQADQASIAGVQARTSSHKGQVVLELELGYPSKWRSKYRLLPDDEHVIKSVEEYNARGELAFRSEVADYQSFGGILYPTRGFREEYVGSRLDAKVSFETESLETRASQIPESLFQFEVPGDALIWDEDRMLMVRYADIAHSHLNDLVRRLGPRNLWLAWLNVAALIAVGILATLIGVRLRQRRAAARPRAAP